MRTTHHTNTKYINIITTCMWSTTSLVTSLMSRLVRDQSWNSNHKQLNDIAWMKWIKPNKGTASKTLQHDILQILDC